MEQKHNIILYGKENIGKTSTLMHLTLLLSGIGSTHSAWDSKSERFIYKGNKLLDARFAINYKSKLVFIATGGDNWEICKVNYNFFSGIIPGNMKIYGIDKTTGVFEIDNAKFRTNKKEIVIVPDISISACRPEGDRYGAIKSVHSYSEDILGKLSQQLWIQKYPDMDSLMLAKKLQSIIDGLL